MPSIIKVDQIQSDQGFVNVSSNLQFSSGFTMLSPTIASPTFTGQATIPTINLTGGQIVFPASQNASSDANTLDDYEEGTWTATLKGSTTDPTTPVTATGTYTKIGRFVYAGVHFNNVNTTGAAGSVRVTGLPFSGATGYPSNGTCAAYLFDMGGRYNMSLQVPTTTAYVYVSGDDTNWVELAHTAGTGRYLSITAFYEV